MILPIDWLKEFVGVDESPERLAETFLILGFPADAVTNEYLDLEVTPNRGDVLSVYGLAREYAAYKNVRPKPYAIPLKATSSNHDLVSLSKEAKPKVWRYSYFIARGGKVGESTREIKQRLKFTDLNAKNNIIDITNYLMHECGQPLHAFDLDKIKKLHIDFAKEGESIKLLGGDTAKLGAKNLVAYDNQNIVDLVGISGSAIPAIDKDTKNILVQAAVFDPVTIRRSSKASGVITPASYRYERGVDCELPMTALAKTAEYLKKWGFSIETIIDATPNLPAATTIKLTDNDVSKISGSKITTEQVLKPLKRLGFERREDDLYKVPSWRQLDVKIAADLAEEVIRLNGFDKIRPVALSSWPNKFDEADYCNSMRAYFSNRGWTEHYSYSFISAKEARALADAKELNIDIRGLVEVANPLSENNRYMRPTLLIGLLRAASNNRWTDDINLFEIGRVFKKDTEEKYRIGFISRKKIIAMDPPAGFVPINPGDPLGQLFKIRTPFFFTEYQQLPKLPITSIRTNENQFCAISKFPPVVMDIALIIDKNIQSQEVVSKVLDSNPKHIIVAECFDEFENDAKFGKNKKSIAIRIVYQNLDRTLTSQEAQKMHQAVGDLLKKTFNAEIRGSE